MNKPSVFTENPFAFASVHNILTDRHLGISGSIASALTPYSDFCRVQTLQACPVACSDFVFSLQINGKTLPAASWDWLPNAIWRQCRIDGIALSTLTVLPAGMHGCVMALTLQNTTDAVQSVSLQSTLSGTPERRIEWKFPIPDAPAVAPADLHAQTLPQGIIFGTSDTASVAFSSSAPALVPSAPQGNASLTVTPAPGETLTLYFSAHVGSKETVLRECAQAQADYPALCETALSWVTKRTNEILSRLPAFTASNPSLQRLYYRALVTYITNRWENPELALPVWYSTGATNGGCMCSYLWDYSGGMLLHPLVDPEVHKQTLLLYLRNDLTTSYAIMPVDGKPCGPWYQINQEKIINMVYYYVALTGDVAFLHETTGGKTVAEWMVFHALVGDDTSKPVALIDYGQGGVNHLELRHELQYRGVMPDLNARRYANYTRAYALSVLGGVPCPLLLERAAGLKALLPTLWNEQKQWYDFIWQGNRECRMTVQTFKFLNSGVIDERTCRGLLSHLNEDEFLSPYGLHSMAKDDPAYDVVDIDNGGGGICTEFDAMILGQLFDIGRDDLAEDILSRILWWGDNLPYLGDSCAAYTKLQREDTPLQCDISSTSLAGMMIFGLCGIAADFDGNVTICPPRHHVCRDLSLSGVRLRGLTFDLTVHGEAYTVTCGGTSVTKNCGEKTVLHA